MKIEPRNAEAFLRKPDPKIRGVVIYGNDDVRSLQSLWSSLGLLAPWSPQAREHMRALERLIQSSRGRNLDPAEFDQVRLVLTAGERRAVAGAAVVGLPLVVVAILALWARRRRT